MSVDIKRISNECSEELIHRHNPNCSNQIIYYPLPSADTNTLRSVLAVIFSCPGFRV
jgi:hypothetical protein